MEEEVKEVKKRGRPKLSEEEKRSNMLKKNAQLKKEVDELKDKLGEYEPEINKKRPKIKQKPGPKPKDKRGRKKKTESTEVTTGVISDADNSVVEKQILVVPHDEVKGLVDKAQQRNLICVRCGETNPNHFYNTKDRNRQVFGKLCYCKKCVKELFMYYYEKYEDENCAVWYTCRKIDIPYVHECYAGAMKSLGTYDTFNGYESLMPAYMKGIAFADKNGWGTSFDDSRGEENIRNLGVMDTLTKIRRNRANDFTSNVDASEHDEDYEIIEYDTAILQSKWGATLENWELAFLEGEYLDWDEKLGGIDDKSLDILVKQICYQTLEINKDRQSGTSVDKKIKTLRELMSDSGLMERQNANSKRRKTLGMEIEDLERFRPVATPEPIFDDVDGVENYIKGAAGCFFKVVGVENEYTKFYDDWMKDYKVGVINDMLANKQAEEAEIAKISAETTGNT